MFNWAIATALFSYYIFFLGIIGQLNYPYIVFGAGIFIVYSYWILYSRSDYREFRKLLATSTNFEKVLLGIIFLQAVCNLIGALGPEIAFDAVWYHLTIPRIWLIEERIFFIEHGPFYYSLLPKLLEMLYIPSLALGNEVVAKVIHWLFGVLTAILTYTIARHFTSKKYALLATAVFYSNLVVGWQSITAYIDLGRTFYETLSLLALLYATKLNSSRWRYTAAVMVGFAILSKLIALTSLAAIVIIFLSQKKYRDAVITSIISIMIPSAWFVINYMQSGNPVFPIFSTYDLQAPHSIFDPITIWLESADPISPVYIMLFPLIFFFFFKNFNNFFVTQKNAAEDTQSNLYKTLALYCLLTFIFWIVTPRTGGGRFLLPYLPAFSVLVIYPLSRIKAVGIKNVAYAAIIVSAVLSILYRAAANKKYLPVLMGQQTKQEFLQNNLPANFGDNWYYLTDESLTKLYTRKEKPTDLEWEY